MDSFLLFNQKLKYKSNFLYNDNFLSISEEKQQFSDFIEFMNGNLEFLSTSFDFSFFGQLLNYLRYLNINEYFSEDYSPFSLFKKKIFEVFKFKDRVDNSFFF